MAHPYLFRYRKPQAKPPGSGLAPGYLYEHDRDVVVFTSTGSAAVLDNRIRPLVTKKADVEKGEDQKDSWI